MICSSPFSFGSFLMGPSAPSWRLSFQMCSISFANCTAAPNHRNPPIVESQIPSLSSKTSLVDEAEDGVPALPSGVPIGLITSVGSFAAADVVRQLIPKT